MARFFKFKNGKFELLNAAQEFRDKLRKTFGQPKMQFIDAVLETSSFNVSVLGVISDAVVRIIRSELHCEIATVAPAVFQPDVSASVISGAGSNYSTSSAAASSPAVLAMVPPAVLAMVLCCFS